MATRPAGPVALEKIKIRGLARLFSWAFGLWGGAVCLKALYDLFLGQPEANLYSAQPWTFISPEQWLRYGGFELTYGLACLGLSLCAALYARRLPELIERPIERQEWSLFD